METGFKNFRWLDKNLTNVGYRAALAFYDKKTLVKENIIKVQTLVVYKHEQGKRGK